MLSWLLPYNNVNQSLPLELSTLLGCHRAPGRSPFPLSVYLIYGNIYVAGLLSQLPAVSTRLFSMSASLFLPYK